MRIDLHDDPAVISIALALGISEDEVVGKLHRLWGWASRQTRDGCALVTPQSQKGNAASAPILWVDRYLGVSGFAQAMIDAGWLAVQDGGFTFPKWDVHNSQVAKKKTLAAIRAAASKAKKGCAEGNASVALGSQKGNAASAPTPESAPLCISSSSSSSSSSEKKKRKGVRGKLPPLPAEIDTPEFREAWERWQAHRREKKKPLTPTSVAQQFRLFVAWGAPRAIAAIDHTIFKGWEGIREPDAPRDAARRQATLDSLFDANGDPL